MSGISDMLMQSLDLIGSEVSNGIQNNGPSASRLLMEEKRNLKQKLEFIDQTDFQVPSKNIPIATGGLFNEIADSKVDAPKYWKTSEVKKTQQKGMKVAKTAPIVSKKVLEKKERGENYNDRLQAKLMKQKSKGKR